MSYDFDDRGNQIRARAMLRYLLTRLPEAQAKWPLEENYTKSKAVSVAKDWHRLSNVNGVHVLRLRNGWQSALTFSGMPLGIMSRAFIAPVPTKNRAVYGALAALMRCANTELLPPPVENERDWRFFHFDSATLGVRLWNVRHFAEQIPRVRQITEDDIMGEFAYLRHKITGSEPVTDEIIQMSPMRDEVLKICGIALAAGYFSFDMDDAYHDPDAADEPTETVAPAMR